MPLSERFFPFVRSGLALVALLALSACAAYERPQPANGRSISSSESIVLGGVTQYLRIRGDDAIVNPVLLFVHGGPGLPETPVAHLNADLERDFTVVQWDQRGTGRSYRSNPTGMNAQQFTADLLELSRYLKARFGGRRIYLLGFSWGSLIAARAVVKEPELYAAYIGLSQLVSVSLAERVLHGEAVLKARRLGKPEAAAELERIGPPPWRNLEEKARSQRIEEELEEPLPHRLTTARMITLGWNSPAYGPTDFFKILPGAHFSYARLRRDLRAADLLTEIRTIPVPVWILVGQHDTVLSSTLAERWFQGLRAPHGKWLRRFSQSAHAPHLEEPEKYREVMREVRRGPHL